MARNFPALSASLWLLTIGVAPAEDFKLSDGTVFRGVKVLEVRPDALILSHDHGVAMADLAKLPKSLRARYGYDPGKAAAYREREAASAQAVAAENRRLVAALEERRMAAARLEMETGESASPSIPAFGDTQFSYRSGANGRADPSGVARLSAEIGHAQVERRAAELARQEFWTADFWHHPAVKILGALLGGAGGGGGSSDSASAPRNWR